MELSRHTSIEASYSAKAASSRPAKPPVYVTMQLALCVGVLALATSAVALGRLVTMSPSFSGYGELFSNDAEQAAIEEGLACRDMGRGVATTSTHRVQRCAGYLGVGPFSRITMTIAVHDADHRTMRAAFTVRQNAMTLGDLILLWEDARVELRGELITVHWPAQNLTATTRRANGEVDEGINYLMPLALVSFRATQF